MRVKYVLIYSKLKFGVTFKEWNAVHEKNSEIRAGCCDEVGAYMTLLEVEM